MSLHVIVVLMSTLYFMFLNTGCTPGCSYFYLKVENLDSSTSSNSSQNNNENNDNPTNINPTSPQNVSGLGRSFEIDLSWTNSPGATQYTVQVGTLSGVYFQNINTGIFTSPTTLTSLNTNTNYFITVTSHFADGTSYPSSEIQVATLFNCNDLQSNSRIDLYGQGTSQNPYIICSPLQLQKLGDQSTQSNAFLSQSFKLGSDIDLSSISSSFQPIGTYSNPFTGKLDGNSKTIINWNAINITSASNIGIFGYTKKAEIHHLNLENINLQTTSSVNIGALAGYIDDNTKIEDINYDQITITDTLGTNIGGLIGQAQGGLINISAGSNVQIISNGTSLGGVIGRFNTKFYTKHSDCQSYALNIYSSAQITGSSTIGGIVGDSYNYINGPCKFIFYKNIFDGIIQSTGTGSSNLYFGGIAGKSRKAHFFNSTFLGKIFGSEDVGGITGLELYSYLHKTISIGTLNGFRYVGGLTGQSNSSMITESISAGSYSASSDTLGGFIGDSIYDKVFYSVFKGQLNATNTDTGGFVGSTSVSEFYYSYSKGQIITSGSSNYVGAIAGAAWDPYNNYYGIYWDRGPAGNSGLSNFCGRFGNVDCNIPVLNNLGITSGSLKAPTFLFANSSNNPGWSFFGVNDAPNDIWMIDPITGYPELFWTQYNPVVDSPFPGGSGTESDPYLLNHPDQFNIISQNSELLTKHYKTSDYIDFNTISSTFIPWGDFTGSLEGGVNSGGSPFALNSLNITNATGSNLGLVGGNTRGTGVYAKLYEHIAPIESLSGKYYFTGLFKNLHVNNFNIQGVNNLAPLVASNSANYIFSNVDTASNVIIGTGDYIGGIASKCFLVNESSSVSISPFINGKNKVGGICGQGYFFNKVVSDLNNINGINYVGGIFGITDNEVSNQDFSVDLTKKVNFSAIFVSDLGFSITATGTFVGGITGSATNSKYEYLNSFTGGDITGAKTVGGIFGSLSNSSLKNSSSGNTYLAENQSLSISNQEVGGLIGVADHVIVENSYVKNSGLKIDGAKSNLAGGLIGHIISSSTILKSYFLGQISVTSGTNVGGLVGRISTTGTITNYSVISNSFSNATMTGPGSITGGLVGEIDSASAPTITNSYFAGTNQCSGSSPGAIVGLKNSSTTTFSSNFWDITLNPTLSDTGAGSLGDNLKIKSLTTTEFKDQNTFNSSGWDFSNTWIISGTINSGYPSLR